MRFVNWDQKKVKQQKLVQDHIIKMQDEYLKGGNSMPLIGRNNDMIDGIQLKSMEDLGPVLRSNP